MEKVKVFFPENHEYNGKIFEKGQVYELEEECPGFIKRWLNRGCSIVEEKVIIEEEKIVEVEEVVEETPVEAEIVEELEVEEKKPAKRAKKKAAKK